VAVHSFGVYLVGSMYGPGGRGSRDLNYLFEIVRRLELDMLLGPYR
jgi:hypothetical protein